MASRYNRTQIAHAPIPALAATMLRFDRNTLAGFVEVAVAILDCSDGDPELEEDDASGQYDEDCYTGPIPHGFGAGCLISDSDRGEDGY
jgi:hypothetical protein